MLLHLKHNPDHPVLKYMASEVINFEFPFWFVNILLWFQNAARLLDTTLIANDGEIRCHAAVVLANMSFLEQYQKDYIVILPDCTCNDIEEMLSICYTGR